MSLSPSIVSCRPACWSPCQPVPSTHHRSMSACSHQCSSCLLGFLRCCCCACPLHRLNPCLPFAACSVVHYPAYPFLCQQAPKRLPSSLLTVSLLPPSHPGSLPPPLPPSLPAASACFWIPSLPDSQPGCLSIASLRPRSLPACQPVSQLASQTAIQSACLSVSIPPAVPSCRSPCLTPTPLATFWPLCLPSAGHAGFGTDDTHDDPSAKWLT